MRYVSLLFVLALGGCSTHPVSDTLDYLKPGKMYANEVEPYGGVLIQQGSILAPGIPGPPPTAPGIVPPAVPLPGTPGTNVPPPPSFPPAGP